MILSRIASALKAQNWVAVVIEFVIVIAGVVIGFQITAWNAGRQERVDEERFLVDLHEDVVLAETLSGRLRERRLTRLDETLSMLDTLFRRNGRDSLTVNECITIGSLQYFNINVPDLTAFTELAEAGRIDIIRDDDLRRALVNYRQSRTALRDYIAIQSNVTYDVTAEFPDLVYSRGYFDEGMGEIRNQTFCDLEAMRADPRFLTAISRNADAYDAYVRDGLRPWSDQLDRVHGRLDEILGLTHGGTNS
ncbi:hypothetical protein V0U79_06130 [Hyphobacterium sp. HN65]|uniref:Uncharacterized protein n=1 Tax=Hyphobacterium lacteum TaxID=3116575 RepID=A0ABU7LPW0_9PROT|nr:hypothetical protein [Hyphobacterium sp. HN65]MEE2525937.1 hypothetical protein [Hyphobacterium sp. HN65]